MTVQPDVRCPRRRRKSVTLAALTLLAAATITTGAATQSVDPLASNNGLYPSAEQWQGPFRVANLAYPRAPVPSTWMPGAGLGRLTTATAEAYVAALKAHLEPTIGPMIDEPRKWSPREQGWYDMVWSGQGTPGEDGAIDPNSGRDALLTTYTGQILPRETFSPRYRPSVPVQNHAVIYYNGVAAAMLGRLWNNLYEPDLEQVVFPEGSIVVKAEAVTPTPEQWPVLEGAAVWNVFRPSVEDQQRSVSPLVPRVLELRVLQMTIGVKDTVASPETGWVFIGLVYDADAPGETSFERMVALGAQWGNDPEFARYPDGRDPAGAPLEETWVNPDAPAFVGDTLGWGGRLAGPMDVATRHNVLTPSGRRYQGADHLRVSSCLSCHGAAEFPFTSNLYPSPNKSFPKDGEPFLLYDPGSPEWARWFQNRPGDLGMTTQDGAGTVGLDYDMLIMFALSSFNAAMGADVYVQKRFDVH